jgi:hypothetical protein
MRAISRRTGCELAYPRVARWSRLPAQTHLSWVERAGCPHRRTGGLAKGIAGHFPQSASAYYLKSLETAAPSLALKLKALPVSNAGEIERKSPN